MSDLISRSALLDEMDKRYNKKKDIVPNNLAEGFMQMENLIKEQPTAYDTEKVVENLASNSRFIDDINEHNIKCISCVIGQKTAIDIVRKGGVR